MKTWNPVKLAINLFRYLHPANRDEMDAFISAGFRLGAWGAALGIATAIAIQAVLVFFFDKDYDLAASATRAAKGTLTAVVSLRGMEGFVEDTGIMRVLLRA